MGIMARMVPSHLQTALAADTWKDFPPYRLVRAFVAWLGSWRRVVFFGALALVMMLSPVTYDRINRSTIATNPCATDTLL